MQIIVTDYQTSWPTLFSTEKVKIVDKIGFLAPAVEHIGSTSVAGLCAKPVIDIMVGVSGPDKLDEVIEPLQKLYTYVRQYESSWPSRRFFGKYNCESGKAVPALIESRDSPPDQQGLISSVNIHVFANETLDWRRHRALRDFLRTMKMKGMPTAI